ncbi:MAG TPA: phosphopantetheine-binding protein [Chitinophagaceae bacterium]
MSSINITEFDDDDNLFESGIVNSLFAVQLMTFIEKAFAIEVEMEDLDIENFKSVSATAAFVARKNLQQAA